MRTTRLVIINDRSEARGGATALALRSAVMLQEIGVPVTYIAGDSGPAPALENTRVSYVALGLRAVSAQRLDSAAFTGLWSSAASERLREWIEQNDTRETVYHVHGWQKILSPAVFHALRAVKHRVLIHAHDYFLACPNGAFMHYPSGKACQLEPLTLSCVVSRCDRRSYAHKGYRVLRQVVQNAALELLGSVDILLIHEGMRPHLVRGGLDGSRMYTVLNPCQPFSATPIAAHLNKKFYFVGALRAEKGAEDLAAAGRRAGVPVCIIGDGPNRARLERAFPEVRFEGWRDAAEISRLVQDARCVVMPSRYPEPFGLVAVEALASGLPVIASEHSMLAADIQRLGIGLSANTSDEVWFAAALSRLASDDALVQQMSARAVESAAALASTPTGWRDALLRHYERITQSCSVAGGN